MWVLILNNSFPIADKSDNIRHDHLPIVVPVRLMLVVVNYSSLLKFDPVLKCRVTIISTIGLMFTLQTLILQIL